MGNVSPSYFFSIPINEPTHRYGWSGINQRGSFQATALTLPQRSTLPVAGKSNSVLAGRISSGAITREGWSNRIQPPGDSVVPILHGPERISIPVSFSLNISIFPRFSLEILCCAPIIQSILPINNNTSGRRWASPCFMPICSTTIHSKHPDQASINTATGLP